jgi:hypothetical protein
MPRQLESDAPGELRYAGFIASVSAQGVISHQLLGHLFREGRLKPASDVDGCEFLVLAPVVGPEFSALELEFGSFPSAWE